VKKQVKAPETSVTHLRNALLATFHFKKTLAEGMFTVANVPVYKDGRPVYKDGKKKVQATAPVLTQKDPCEIFEGATFKGMPVPSEAFIRVLIIKPIFEKAYLASFTDPGVKLTDAYLETKGDARQYLQKLCENWSRIYRGSGLSEGMSEERIGHIMAFFRFEGNRIYIADPTNGHGTRADVESVSSTQPKAETIAKN